MGKIFQIWWNLHTHRSKNLKKIQAQKNNTTKKMPPRYSVINLLQTSDKENIFKAVREEKDT